MHVPMFGDGRPSNLRDRRRKKTKYDERNKYQLRNIMAVAVRGRAAITR